MSNYDISFVIPLKNEAESIETLYKGIVENTLPLDLSFEIIFIDDGSTDDSFNIIKT